MAEAHQTNRLEEVAGKIKAVTAPIDLTRLTPLVDVILDTNRRPLLYVNTQFNLANNYSGVDFACRSPDGSPMLAHTPLIPINFPVFDREGRIDARRSTFSYTPSSELSSAQIEVYDWLLNRAGIRR